jgi:hypothetical protein
MFIGLGWVGNSNDGMLSKQYYFIYFCHTVGQKSVRILGVPATGYLTQFLLFLCLGVMLRWFSCSKLQLCASHIALLS